MKITQATYDATNRTASPSAGTTQSFVTVSGTSVSKTSSLTLSSLSLDAGGKTTLCYIIEYYQEFFNHVRNDTNVSVDEMNFINDIEFVIEFVEQ